MTSRRERVRWYGTAVVVLALVVLGVSLGALALRQVEVEVSGFRSARVELIAARAETAARALDTEVAGAFDDAERVVAGEPAQLRRLVERHRIVEQPFFINERKVGWPRDVDANANAAYARLLWHEQRDAPTRKLLEPAHAGLAGGNLTRARDARLEAELQRAALLECGNADLEEVVGSYDDVFEQAREEESRGPLLNSTAA